MSFWGRSNNNNNNNHNAAPAPPPFQPPPPAAAAAAAAAASSGPEIDATTIASLLGVLALLCGAYLASRKALPRHTSRKTRILFIWHLFDALVHFVFEGSFLYNCFFVWYALPGMFGGHRHSYGGYGSRTAHMYPPPPPTNLLFLTPPDVYWLGRRDRVYGAAYGEGWWSRVWQEYAKADRRWGGTDLTVVTLEVVTVGVAGPLALWICWLLAKGDERKGGGKKGFWMVVLATAEIYGGWMTFAPEWFSGSPNLDTSNWLYFWVYLVFFNGLWVVFPLWILYEAYQTISASLSQAEMVDLVHYLKKDD